MTARRYFTLIELLVVIAVIAILASILLPSLNHARERARTTDCINKLKTIGTVSTLYQNDYEGYFPGYYGPSADTFRSECAPYFGLKQGSLDGGPMLKKHFHCPSDTANANGYYNHGQGYAQNFYVRHSLASTDAVRRNSQHRYRPETVMYFADFECNGGARNISGATYPLYVVTRTVEAIGTRHAGKTANILLLTGAVQNLPFAVMYGTNRGGANKIYKP